MVLRTTIALIAALVFFGGFAKAQTEEETPISQCEVIQSELELIYNTLYDIDVRPLEIDQYKAFRDALNQIRSTQDNLASLCMKNPDQPSTEVKVYEDSFSWGFTSTFENPCQLSQITEAQLANFEETAVRNCYREGYSRCAVKAAARVYDLTASRSNPYSWTCTAKTDVVIEASK